jgi:type II secretory pathway component GspD/PulD (secretin)
MRSELEERAQRYKRALLMKAFGRQETTMFDLRIQVRSYAIATAGLAIAAILLVASACAQDADAKSAPTKQEPEEVRTIFLKNITEQHDLNDLTTDLRNVLNRAKIYAVASQNAITIRATAEDMLEAQKLLADIDRPKKVYRVTFTIAESDAGKKTGVQHYAMIVTGDNKGYVKLGNRVPIVTGSADKDNSSPMTQVQYLDVGVNIEASVSGVALRTKVEQSSLADEKSNVGIQDPLVKQITLEGTSTFTPGKAVALGSIDIPGTARHQDIEFVAELVP